MRLLLTRAAADASRTRATLEARGHEVIVSPLTEIVPTGAIRSDGGRDGLVATSAQAFVGSLEGAVDDRAAHPLYLVGQRTAEAARARGFTGPTMIAPDVAALIAMLDGQTATLRLVYWAGRDRKPDLEAALAVRGHQVDVVETYEARATGGLSEDARHAFRNDGIDAILHFSRRGAALFLAACDRAGISATDRLHLCLSEDVAAPLRDAACGRLKTAKAPNEAALFSLLDRAKS